MTSTDTATSVNSPAVPASAVSAEMARLWAALIVLGTALFANQYVTLRKLKALLLDRAAGDPVATLGQRVWPLVTESWTKFLTPEDLLVTTAIVASLSYIVYAERKRAALTTLLQRVDASPAWLWAFLGLGTLVITRGYLNPGQVFMGDAETHMLRAWMFVEHFRNWETPIWSNAWYGGFPLLAHYGPLYFIATAIVTLMVGDIHTATKLILWLCHVGSVAGMFLYLRQVTRKPLPSLVGAFAYALAFHRVHILLYQGDLQIAVVFLLMPFVLLVAERFIDTRRHARRTFVVTALLLAVMILSHHGYAFFALVLTGIYLAARLAATGGPLADRVRMLAFFASTQIAAVLVSSVLLLPFLFEMQEHRGMPNTVGPMLTPNPIGPLVLVKMFRWAAIGDGGSLGYIGLSIGILAAVGVVHGFRRRDPAAIGLAALGLSSLLMIENNVAYNVKNVNFFVIAVSAMAAWALVSMMEPGGHGPRVTRSRARWGERFPAHAGVLMLGLLLVDLGPTTFQSVYRENYEFKQPMYARVAALGEPYKVVERMVFTYDPSRPPDASFDGNRLGVPSAYAPLQSPIGFFHEGAGRSFGYNTELVKRLQRDLNRGQLTDHALRGLYVLGVKYVLFRDRYRWFTPALPPSDAYRVEPGLVQLTYATPLLLSTRVVSVEDVPGYPLTDLMVERKYSEGETYDYNDRYDRTLVEPLIAAMGLDMARGTAHTLVARRPEARVDLGGGDDLDVRIAAFSTTLKRVDVSYESNREAVGQVPYTYFPYLRVEVDGAAVPFERSAMNAILLRVPAGAHTVTVHGMMPPMQRATAWLSLASLVAVLVVPGRLFAWVERH